MYIDIGRHQTQTLSNADLFSVTEHHLFRPQGSDNCRKCRSESNKKVLTGVKEKRCELFPQECKGLISALELYSKTCLAESVMNQNRACIDCKHAHHKSTPTGTNASFTYLYQMTSYRQHILWGKCRDRFSHMILLLAICLCTMNSHCSMFNSPDNHVAQVPHQWYKESGPKMHQVHKKARI